MAKFLVPENIFIGPGCLAELAGVVSHLKASRVTVVTGRSWARESGVLKRISDMLSAAGVTAEAFEGVPEEPPCPLIDQLRERLKANGTQLVIGLGGGSAMDAAKAGAILVESDQSTVSHVYSQKVPATGLPVITIPTTSGSGSEVTPVAVLTDETKKVKMSIRGEAMMPKAAIVDPELTVTCAPGLTAVAGMDAFVQAIESYCSKFSHHLSDALTEKAIALIAKNLLQVYRDGTDLSARQAMAEGSLLAGMALANVRLGAVHGLAHPLGATYKIPHGLVCAVLMPVVLEFNKPALYTGSDDKYSRLCNLLMADPVEFVQRLLAELNLPTNLREYKIREDDLDALAEQALISGSTKANPRATSKADLIEIIRRVM